MMASAPPHPTSKDAPSSMFEAEFIAAVLDSNRQAPQRLKDGQGRAPGCRFDVYRNNVSASLRAALCEGFPVVTKLLGVENMQGLADIHLRDAPPTSPLMMHYGADFPSFLERFEPLSHLGYLGDIARLELALRRSYHAKDTEEMDPARLGALSPETLMRCRLQLAPSIEVISSRWPLYDIWRFNTHDDASKPKPVAQDVLITRPDFDPLPQLLPPGGAVWIQALLNGACLAEATDLATQTVQGFDLSLPLTLLIGGAALVDLTHEEVS